MINFTLQDYAFTDRVRSEKRTAINFKNHQLPEQLHRNPFNHSRPRFLRKEIAGLKPDIYKPLLTESDLIWEDR